MLLTIAEILLSYGNKLSRTDLHYMTKYAGLRKIQKIKNGRTVNHFESSDIEKILADKKIKFRMVAHV